MAYMGVSVMIGHVPIGQYTFVQLPRAIREVQP